MKNITNAEDNLVGTIYYHTPQKIRSVLEVQRGEILQKFANLQTLIS